MAVATNLINSGSIVRQVARLSNGWLVTAYNIGRNAFQVVVSKTNGASWSDLCNITATNTTDYVIGVQAILADGVNVLIVGNYGHINGTDRINTYYFNATTVSTTDNLYSTRSSGTSLAFLSPQRVRYFHGRYHYLNSEWSESSNTDYYRHISTDTTDAPAGGTPFVWVARSTKSVFSGSDVYVPAVNPAEAWIFYGVDNVLSVRKRATVTGSFTTAQAIATHSTGYIIRRVRTILLGGVLYIFYSWITSDNSLRGLSYITTADGVSYTASKVLLSNPFSTTNTHMLDFDVLLDGNNIAFLLAIPNGANRLLYTGKFRTGALSIKSTGIVANSVTEVYASINSIATVGKELYFSADLANGSNIVKFKLEVDGIKRFSGSAWESIEQGYRYGTSWQENNGKRFNGTSWQDIT